MGLDQVHQQATAMLANLSAAEGLNQVLRSELERETDADNATKVHEESALKKALNGEGSKVGTQILASLASKLAKQVAPAKLLGDLQEKYGFVLDGQDEQTGDLVSINEAILKAGRSKNNNHGQQKGSNLGGGDEAGGQEQTQSDVKEYIGAYSQTLVNGGQEARKKMERLENKLLKERGVSLKDIKGLKTQVANSVRSEIAQQIKQSYLKQILANSKSMEWLISKRETQGVIHFAEREANLGGFSFGGYNGNLQGTADKMMDETHQMLRDFVDDALKGEVMKKAMGKEEGVEKEIENLLKLGGKIGFDAKEFVDKIPRLKEDLGLNPLISFEFSDGGAGAKSDQRDQHQFQYTAQEEKEIMTDKLRALYMRRAVYGGLRTVLETQFKMIKTKNGLIKLGVINFDQVEKEGRACAKIKLFEMLREAFEERATYAKLQGEAWKMTERKIKTVLKNLENLGVSLTQTELDLIRDKANEKMYREAAHELILINTAIEARGEIAFYTSKRAKVAGILERIAEESGMEAPGHELELSIREAC